MYLARINSVYWHLVIVISLFFSLLEIIYIQHAWQWFLIYLYAFFPPWNFLFYNKKENTLFKYKIKKYISLHEPVFAVEILFSNSQPVIPVIQWEVANAPKPRLTLWGYSKSLHGFITMYLACTSCVFMQNFLWEFHEGWAKYSEWSSCWSRLPAGETHGGFWIVFMLMHNMCMTFWI